MDKYFIFHNNEKLMRIKDFLRVDHPIHPSILNAFNSNAEFKKEYMELLYSRHFLLMPCHRSPLMTLIKAPNKWIHRFTDSFAVLSEMLTIIQCFTINPALKYYNEHKEHLDLCRAKWLEATEKIDSDMNEKIQPLYTQQDLNEKQKLERFLTIMEAITLRRIHSYELCIAKMFNINCEGILTPKICPPASSLPDDNQKMIPKVLCHFFMIKQSIMNDRLKLASGDDFKEVKYFDLEEMAGRLESTPKEEIYKGYMDRYTAWEFFQFMKIE
jgi:hypothetical protein